MELIPLLSQIILAATIATVVFAGVSYLAYRTREKKAPPVRKAGEGQMLLEPQFFRRYKPAK